MEKRVGVPTEAQEKLQKVKKSSLLEVNEDKGRPRVPGPRGNHSLQGLISFSR